MSELIRSTEIIASEINLIKRQTAVTCLNTAVEIGKLLVEAKAALQHGEWGKWLEDNVDYSVSTANNLMKLFECYGDKQQGSLFAENCIDIFGALSPSKALALTALSDEQRVEYVQEHDVENESVREMKKQIEELKKFEKACKQKDKEIKDLKKRADETSARANDYMHQADDANNRAKEAEKKLLEVSQQTSVNEESIRKEYAEELDRLKERLKRAENSDVQRFAVHFELLQKELVTLQDIIKSQTDTDIAEKLRLSLIRIFNSFQI